jgi:hypothetical protein
MLAHRSAPMLSQAVRIFASIQVASENRTPWRRKVSMTILA